MSKIRSKIDLAKQKDNEIVEQELVYYEDIRKEKIRKDLIKLKVRELCNNDNYHDIIQANIDRGKKYTKQILETTRHHNDTFI